jgi:hypothetical protein
VSPPPPTPPYGHALHAAANAVVRLQACTFSNNSENRRGNSESGSGAAALSLESSKGTRAASAASPGAIYSDVERGEVWVWVVDEQQLHLPLPMRAAQNLGRQTFARPQDDALLVIQEVRVFDLQLLC